MLPCSTDRATERPVQSKYTAAGNWPGSADFGRTKFEYSVEVRKLNTALDGGSIFTY